MREIHASIPADWLDTLECALSKTEDGSVRYIAIVYEDGGHYFYSLQGFPEARDMLASALTTRAELERIKANAPGSDTRN